MVDESAEHDDAASDSGLDVLNLTDEVIGLSAEIGELRSRIDLALERATAAAEVAQAAEVAASAAAQDTAALSEYLGELTSGLGARPPAASESRGELVGLSRDELIARVEELEATLQRRSVQAALVVTKKLRGS